MVLHSHLHHRSAHRTRGLEPDRATGSSLGHFTGCVIERGVARAEIQVPQLNRQPALQSLDFTQCMSTVRVPIGNRWFHQTEYIKVDLIKGLLTKVGKGSWKTTRKRAAPPPP